MEVHAFPQLTSVGAWRGGRDGVPTYGGFYTQDEVQALSIAVNGRQPLLH